MLGVGCTQATVHGQQQIALLEAEGDEKVDEVMKMSCFSSRPTSPTLYRS
uniref:Uncharacterized protein n=1 Tax=Arundo donax TaxID=35708 RepID=A0A0A9E2R9_ARUDO